MPQISVIKPNINDILANLNKINWNFEGVTTDYLTHGMHPYPAKFIPQIPSTLISELSSVGDTVLDPFCGSGTTLVEALRLNRHAIGIDANPLAGLISQAKTTQLSDNDIEELQKLAFVVGSLSKRLRLHQTTLSSFKGSYVSVKQPAFDDIDFWFYRHVIDELALIKDMCINLESQNARRVALTALSSIIISVSKQDSDTRYVRRDKNINVGDVARRFQTALDRAIIGVREIKDRISPEFNCQVLQSDILSSPKIPQVDLVVCSPPYPNAYSYHLYHRLRMLWLDMDPLKFKPCEIGSHRKYSLKGTNAANADTFRNEFRKIFSWLSRVLRSGKYACLVIGDSIVKGDILHNDEIIIDVAKENGFQLKVNLQREIQNTKKAFNPLIGRIKNENIIILENNGG